jgi:glucose/arabinose dehydrogenase
LRTVLSHVNQEPPIMSSRFVLGSCVLLFLAASPTSVSHAQLELVVQASDGLDNPIYVTGTGIPGDERLFIATRDGRIEVWDGQSLAPTPYLDLTSEVDEEAEGGMLGLAFSSDFAVDGRFYVYYTAGNPNVNGDLVSRVSRFEAEGDPRTSNIANPTETILAPFPLDQPRSNHNGGTLQVRGDALYIALGDGGLASSSAQDDSTILGKLIRFDLSQDPPPFEIVAKGLRNPYRFSIDSLTGDLYIGDVGGFMAEEISVATASALATGVALGQTAPINFGWPIEEGFVCREPQGSPPCGDPALTAPIFDYNHSNGRVAVVGGVVYRGPDPSLQGLYFFGDYLAADFWSLEWNAIQGLVEAPVSENTLFAPISRVVGFGTGTDGAVYVVDPNDAIYRVPEPSVNLMSVVAIGSALVMGIFRRRVRSGLVVNHGSGCGRKTIERRMT